jgi:hypothetical protein
MTNLESVLSYVMYLPVTYVQVYESILMLLSWYWGLIHLSNPVFHFFSSRFRVGWSAEEIATERSTGDCATSTRCPASKKDGNRLSSQIICVFCQSPASQKSTFLLGIVSKAYWLDLRRIFFALQIRIQGWLSMKCFSASMNGNSGDSLYIMYLFGVFIVH